MLTGKNCIWRKINNAKYHIPTLLQKPNKKTRKNKRTEINFHTFIIQVFLNVLTLLNIFFGTLKTNHKYFVREVALGAATRYIMSATRLKYTLICRAV